MTKNRIIKILDSYLNGESVFFQLNSYDKGEILKYINKQKINIRILGCRGYDILKKEFFTDEYLYDDVVSWNCKLETKYFSTFEEYFEYINGNIYTFSSYFGYAFSMDQIVKYNIIISKLNFSGFVENNILFYNFRNVRKEKQTRYSLYEIPRKYHSYKINKYYKNSSFVVEQKWFDIDDKEILSHEKSFTFFADFVQYLDNDISNADLLMCDGIENILFIKNLKYDNITVKSEVAKVLGLKLNPFALERLNATEFENSNLLEVSTIKTYLEQRNKDNDYSDIISYISDIHLLHRYKNFKCETVEDIEYVNRYIVEKILNDDVKIKLISGDICSDFGFYQSFIKTLGNQRSYQKIFVTLGNHELWCFDGFNLDNIIEIYKKTINDQNMYLVHNNLFFLENHYYWKELTTNELLCLDDKQIRDKLRGAELIIFGGIGFAGKNNNFNADKGIYRNSISRENEIYQSELFCKLYSKVARALFDKNVIILTHMPKEDWSDTNEYIDHFVYVSGHNHHNYFFDDGNKRIYSDNQVGYSYKSIGMKYLSIDMNYDWFSDYKDGIHKITRLDYIMYYKGLGQTISFNREFKNLYMLKREKTYMFLMKTSKDNLLILNGGTIKKSGEHTIEYFYDNLLNYASSVKMFLSQYNDFQRNISSEIKEIGGDGTIHGSIIDIDFYNHLYINPLDGTITPYYATSMIDKYVYPNTASLLKYKCPNLYKNYELINQGNEKNNQLTIYQDTYKLYKKSTFVPETYMYKISRILKGLQYTTKYNVVRIWNDKLIENPSYENGKLIVSEIIKQIEQ